jgi:DNA-binding response OmpR family regulator
MFPKGRILCTEDNADTRELVTFVLSGEGYEVTCANSPAHTLALARDQSFDLYLMDSWLPDLSGVELTRKLREFDVRTPVLFYSGAGFESDKEAARLAGAQGYLVKPVLHENLIKEVRRLIETSAGHAVGR